MSVGPWLLVCLPTGAAVWCTAGAGWLTGLTGVGHLTSVACSSNSSGKFAIRCIYVGLCIVHVDFLLSPVIPWSLLTVLSVVLWGVC